MSNNIQKKLSGQLTAAEIQQAQKQASFARSEVAEARDKQQQAEAALLRNLKALLQNPLGQQKHSPL